jgi:hypothetical protein
MTTGIEKQSVKNYYIKNYKQYPKTKRDGVGGGGKCMHKLKLS